MLRLLELLSFIIIFSNFIFYYNQSIKREDFTPVYPDAGIAIFFSITAFSGFLYGHRWLKTGLRYPNPLPLDLIVHGLLILILAEVIFILSFYSPFAKYISHKIYVPRIYDDGSSTPFPVITSLLILGVCLYLLSIFSTGIPLSDLTNPSIVRKSLSSSLTGPLNVLAYNLILVTLPLFFLFAIRDYGLRGWPSIVSFGIIAPLSISGKLSHIIVPVFSLLICYHFYYKEISISKLSIPAFLFIFISTVGKSFRNYAGVTSPTDALFLSIQAFIFNIPQEIINKVIGRLSSFGSFLTVVYLESAGRQDILWGSQLLDFWCKLIPSSTTEGKTPRFSGGYYTHEIYPGIPPANHNTALGALGEWYLHFHLIGIIIGVILFGIIFRVWTEMVVMNSTNIGVISFHATNSFYIFMLIPFNSPMTRSLILRTSFYIAILALLNFRLTSFPVSISD